MGNYSQFSGKYCSYIKSKSRAAQITTITVVQNIKNSNGKRCRLALSYKVFCKNNISGYHHILMIIFVRGSEVLMCTIVWLAVYKTN